MSLIENLVGHKSHQQHRPYANMFTRACWHQQLKTKCTSMFYSSPFPLHTMLQYVRFHRCKGAVMRVRAANGWHDNGGTICVTPFFINTDWNEGQGKEKMYRGHSTRAQILHILATWELQVKATSLYSYCTSRTRMIQTRTLGNSTGAKGAKNKKCHQPHFITPQTSY